MLSGLTNLTGLGIDGNSISDISPLSGLTNLRWLGLSDNSISDISVLAGLTSLEHLRLSNNRISNLAPLVSNTGLGSGNNVFGSGDYVDVSRNPLSATSLNTHIPILQSRGVEVSFHSLLINDPTPVTIPDVNLRTVIANSLGKANGVTITRTDMSTLTRLEAPNSDISDLTGLEFATGLTYLHLDNNGISDVSALSGLTSLTYLGLDNNWISDVSVLAGLTSLTYLHLDNNGISDVSALSGLTRSDISGSSCQRDLRCVCIGRFD